MSYLGKVSAKTASAADIGTGAVTSTGILDGTIANADINASAAIDATKIADGTVSSTEFQYINSLTADAQTQITARLPLAGGTMLGEINAADQLVTRPEIKDYSETYNASTGNGTVDLDLTTGNVFKHTASGGNVTFTFSNPSASGKSCSFTLIWVQDSSDRTITWPAAVDWKDAGTAPSVTSGSAKVDIYTFFTVDAGTTWYGFQAGADMA